MLEATLRARHGRVHGVKPLWQTTDEYSFTTLHSFTGGNDGAFPAASLFLIGNTLYGTTIRGGSSGNGTVFTINTNGTGFMTLNSGGISLTNLNLFQSGNDLYGIGGNSSNTTVYILNTNGTGFTLLYNFNNSSFGRSASILSGNALYGTTDFGSSSSNGAVFSLSWSPLQLAMTCSKTNVILTWPTYAPGVMLQSTTNLVSPAVWSTNLPSPALVNGQNAVTNPVSGAQMFFRLSQ